MQLERLVCIRASEKRIRNGDGLCCHCSGARGTGDVAGHDKLATVSNKQSACASRSFMRQNLVDEASAADDGSRRG